MHGIGRQIEIDCGRAENDLNTLFCPPICKDQNMRSVWIEERAVGYGRVNRVGRKAVAGKDLCSAPDVAREVRESPVLTAPRYFVTTVFDSDDAAA